ncbi:MAG: efflux RND transporter periplasmic adaptor subunit [Myxococcales bacterium]|nr:efflux RND transporter periplasmic adaptor subunit [Myxococcales bacterium]
MRYSVASRLLLIAALAAPGLVGCGESSASKETAKPEPPPAKVKVAPVRRGALTAKRTFLGYVTPLSTTTLAAAVAGTVAAVTVRPGDVVEAGAVLVRLDRDLIEPRLAAARAAQKQAEAEASLSRRELERTAKLAAPVITEAERERFASAAEVQGARVRAARAEVERLQAELARHTVEAPFAGTVQRREVEPGMWVNPGQAMVGLVSSGALQVEVDVDVAIARYLRPGTAVKLAGTPPIAATVKGVVPALDETTRTVRVRIEPDAADERLLPGMPVDVTFAYATGEGLLVSRDALVRGPGGVRVVKAVDGKAAPVEVVVEATSNDEAIIRGEGLAVDDRVLVRGNERIRPGQPIAIME